MKRCFEASYKECSDSTNRELEYFKIQVDLESPGKALSRVDLLFSLPALISPRLEKPYPSVIGKTKINLLSIEPEA